MDSNVLFARNLLKLAMRGSDMRSLLTVSKTRGSLIAMTIVTVFLTKSGYNFPKICQYCGPGPNPSWEHMSTHNHYACTEMPEEERTFHRRDNLVQHVYNVHKVDNIGCMADTTQQYWYRKTLPLAPDDPLLICKFCEFVSST
jgi:hypothetical protein